MQIIQLIFTVLQSSSSFTVHTSVQTKNLTDKANTDSNQW